MFTTNAEVREEQGRGASHHLCVANKFPAIIYGDKETLLTIKLDHNEVTNMQAKVEFYNEVLIIVVDGKEVKVKAQDVQRHPYKPKLQHVDFVRA